MNILRRGFLARCSGALGLASISGAQTSLFAASRAENTSIFNVKDFGAKGDGVSSDSEAIQKALDAAGEVNGTVYLPSGVYLCHDLQMREHTTLLADPQWEYRQSAGAILKLDSENADCVLNITGAFGAHIKGVYFLGLPSAKKKIHGIFLNNPEKWSQKEDTIIIDDCNINKFSGNGVYLLRIWLFIVRHSIMQANRMCGLRVMGWDGFVLDNQFAANHLDGFGADEKSSTIMVTANRIEWNHRYGLHLLNGNALNVTGNCFDKNFGAAVYAGKMRTSTFSGNIFRYCGWKEGFAENNLPSSQFIMEDCKGIAISANSASVHKETDNLEEGDAPKYGFSISKSKDCVISCNTFYKAFTADFFNDMTGNQNVVFETNAACKSNPKKKNK